MFNKFFYTLKEKGLKVTLTEWLTLQEALDKHDLEEVKAKKDDLEKTVQALATKVYQQAQQAQQSAQNENPSNGKHDDAVDADYTEN